MPFACGGTNLQSQISGARGQAQLSAQRVAAPSNADCARQPCDEKEARWLRCWCHSGRRRMTRRFAACSAGAVREAGCSIHASGIRAGPQAAAAAAAAAAGAAGPEGGREPNSRVCAHQGEIEIRILFSTVFVMCSCSHLVSSIWHKTVTFSASLVC